MDIFEDNLIDKFYPQRPSELEDVCLYDFVANYELQGGKRQYRKLTKCKLPNHKLFDPDNENKREEFFYSLVLLHSEMSVVYFMTKKLQSKLFSGCLATRSLIIMTN